MTPLHHAACSNQPVAAERLVEKGANIEAKDKVRSPTCC
jgi:ankyrin repeat protein